MSKYVLKINRTYLRDGKTIQYDYSCSSTIRKYFKGTPFYVSYDVNISSVPMSILNLPFISTLLPISWFVGFDIEVDELDRVFYEQVLKLKQQFSEYYPIISTKKSNLIVGHLLESSNISSNKKAMLYSGGVDAYATLFRHFEEVPDLITIKGADMTLDDEVQWKELLCCNKRTKVLQQNTIYYIESNLREFITSEVKCLVEGFNWYGKIQHGLALSCLTTPLSYLNNYSIVYIASSFDRKEGYEFINWGSIPEIDNLIRFNNTNIVHDGIELTRQEKVNYIVDWTVFKKQNIQLRVCYSNRDHTLNCNKCSKCLMTIFAIINTNKDPNDFGFQVDFSVFDKLKTLLKQGFNDRVKQYFWKEVYLESQNANRFNDSDKEWKQAYLEIDQLLQKGISSSIKELPFIQKLKLNFIYKYPRLFKFYLKIKGKLS